MSEPGSTHSANRAQDEEFFNSAPPVLTEDPAQERINEYWSRWAADYESYQQQRNEKPGETEAWERVWSAALPPVPAKVLDVGTGSGHAAMIIAGLGHQVTGIDLAEGMLAEARAKVGYAASPQFGRGDAADPPFEEGTFDAITARYVLWTLRRPEHALARWLEVLRPGGRLAVVDSLWFPEGIGEPGSTHGDPDGERSQHFLDAYAGAKEDLPVAEARDVSAFSRLIEGAGFTEVSVEELDEIYALDRRHGVAPGHQVQMQYRITAAKPA